MKAIVCAIRLATYVQRIELVKRVKETENVRNDGRMMESGVKA